jgi:hypothetical protein
MLCTKRVSPETFRSTREVPYNDGEKRNINDAPRFGGFV